MNARAPSRPGNYWRERFVAIAREAAAMPRYHGRSLARIRPRLSGAGPARRFFAAAPRP